MLCLKYMCDTVVSDGHDSVILATNGELLVASGGPNQETLEDGVHRRLQMAKFFRERGDFGDAKEAEDAAAELLRLGVKMGALLRGRSE